MGSMAEGSIPGFICRLCSNMSRYVILIYGNDGEQLDLPKKISECLPIQINQEDSLPKTVCIECVKTLNSHYSMLKLITKS